jgi:hypothetical protein
MTDRDIRERCREFSILGESRMALTGELGG